MSETTLRYCATDKEIYDLLMSSKQQITGSVMLELAKDRGIFYSPKDSRETLCNNLSLLPHDYHDLNTIFTHRGQSGKAEKLTSVILNIPLTIDEIKEVANEYKEQAPADEIVITNQIGTDRYNLRVSYSEIDYSKTRLVQRRQKEAEIEFIIEGDKAIMRSPANDKAIDIVHNLKDLFDAKKKTDIPTSFIELTEFNNFERTEFFTSLISKLPDFNLHDVTSLKVESNVKEVEENELDFDDDQNTELAKQEMIALVKDVALRGKSLLGSSEYQQLKTKGFYITSIIWRSVKKSHPFQIVEFVADFEDPEFCKGFKYNVRGAFHFQRGQYTKTLRPIPPEEKQEFLSLIEQTAHIILAELRDKSAEDTATEPINGANP